MVSCEELFSNLENNNIKKKQEETTKEDDKLKQEVKVSILKLDKLYKNII
jgi:hypothetical protein